MPLYSDRFSVSHFEWRRNCTCEPQRTVAACGRSAKAFEGMRRPSRHVCRRVELDHLLTEAGEVHARGIGEPRRHGPRQWRCRCRAAGSKVGVLGRKPDTRTRPERRCRHAPAKWRRWRHLRLPHSSASSGAPRARPLRAAQLICAAAQSFMGRQLRVVRSALRLATDRTGHDQRCGGAAGLRPCSPAAHSLGNDHLHPSRQCDFCDCQPRRLRPEPECAAPRPAALAERPRRAVRCLSDFPGRRPQAPCTRSPSTPRATSSCGTPRSPEPSLPARCARRGPRFLAGSAVRPAGSTGAVGNISARNGLFTTDAAGCIARARVRARELVTRWRLLAAATRTRSPSLRPRSAGRCGQRQQQQRAAWTDRTHCAWQDSVIGRALVVSSGGVALGAVSSRARGRRGRPH